MSNSPKRHHYLPQCYQKNFARKDGVWVYDLQRKTTRYQQIIDTGLERHLYSFERDDGTKDAVMEVEYFSKMDDLIPLLYEKLKRREVLDCNSRYDLAFIAGLMLLRTPDFQNTINRVEGEMIKWITEMSCCSREAMRADVEDYQNAHPEAIKLDPDEVFDFVHSGEYDVTIHRNRSLEHILNFAPSFAQALASLDLMVLHASRRSAFVTTDRPFTIIPPSGGNVPQWGGTGLLTPGGKKILPLGSDIALVFADCGKLMMHVDADQKTVMNFNAPIAANASRFLIGRDEALIRAWVDRFEAVVLDDT